MIRIKIDAKTGQEVARYSITNNFKSITSKSVALNPTSGDLVIVGSVVIGGGVEASYICTLPSDTLNCVQYPSTYPSSFFFFLLLLF